MRVGGTEQTIARIMPIAQDYVSPTMATTLDLTVCVYFFFKHCCTEDLVEAINPLRNTREGRGCWSTVTVLLPSNSMQLPIQATIASG